MHSLTGTTEISNGIIVFNMRLILLGNGNEEVKLARGWLT